MKKFSLLIITLLLVACSSAKTELPAGDATATSGNSAATPAAPAESSEQNQMANPASKNCIDKGGKLEIRKGIGGGEYGVCIFPNGKECEEWAFMRGECSPDEGAAKNAGNGSYTNTTYGFKLNYPTSWKLKESPASSKSPLTLKLTRENNVLTMQIKRASEKTVLNADAPQGGEISKQGTITVLGQEVPLQVVKLEGKVKSVAASASVDDFQIRFQLDNPVDAEIPADVIREAANIAASIE